MNSERVAGSLPFGTGSYAMRRDDDDGGGSVDGCSGCARVAGRAATAVWASERARIALSTGATAGPRAWCVIVWRGGGGGCRTKFVAKRARATDHPPLLGGPK